MLNGSIMVAGTAASKELLEMKVRFIVTILLVNGTGVKNDLPSTMSTE